MKHLCLILIIFLSCKNSTCLDDYSYQKEIFYPIMAETNTGLLANPDGSLTYTMNDANEIGYFMVNNFKNNDWPCQTNINFDRYSPYWIAGEFKPFFNESTTRDTPYNLVHLYHSIFIRYQPQHADSKAYNFFQFAFVPDWQSWMWITANTERNALHFNENDPMRYIAKMDHDENKMEFWMMNLRAGQIVHAESSNHDYPYRPPTNISLPIREIFIGSGSHGNYYGEKKLGRGKESFWGIIKETIVAQGKIDSTDALNWLQYGRKQIPHGTIKYDLTKSLRETLIPLTNWKIMSGKNLSFGGENQLWPGTRHTLKVDAQEIVFNAAQRIDKEELRRRHLLFAAKSDDIESFSFHVKVKDNSGVEKWLKFSPNFSQINQGTTYIEIPLELSEHQWKNFKFDMLYYFNYSSQLNAKELTVLQFKIFGKCTIADILLTNNTDFL